MCVHHISVLCMFLHSLIFEFQLPSSHHSDLALDDITAMRQDRENGGWVQQPVNHMYDPVGRHNVSARQTDALFP